MTAHSDPPAPAAQPGSPDGAWTPPQGASSAPQGPQKNSARKWWPIGGAVLVAGVLGLGSLTGWFGAGDPEAGDCVRMTSDTEFEAVDCTADEAEFTVVGIDEQEMTEPEFQAASVDDLCVDFATTEAVLWIGDMVTEPGTIYCAAAV